MKLASIASSAAMRSSVASWSPSRAKTFRRADAVEYFDDRDNPPEQALCLAHGHLDDARHHALELAVHLTQTHNQLVHLGRLHPED